MERVSLKLKIKKNCQNPSIIFPKYLIFCNSFRTSFCKWGLRYFDISSRDSDSGQATASTACYVMRLAHCNKKKRADSAHGTEFGVWSFVLFNNAWSQKGHSASNTTVILTLSYLLRPLPSHIIFTFVITFSHIFLLLIFYTFLYRFVPLRKERAYGHNYPMLELPLMCLLSNASV